MSAETKQAVRHTALPWKQRALRLEDGARNVIAHCIITRWEGLTPKPQVAEANAAFIIRAVNCHEELLSTLRLLVGYLRNTEHWPIKADHLGYLQSGDAAIQKAERS